MSQEDFMRAALVLAREAFDHGEVPVGCVVVRDGEIVGSGRNRREKSQNALAHAEIEAIDQACRKVGFWRLPDCKLYVTLEPCPMCAGAIISARIAELVFGAWEPKAGAAGSVLNLFEYPFNHKPPVQGGVLAEPCGALLREFFQMLRKN